MKTGFQLAAALFAAVVPAWAAAGAMEECDGATGDRATVAKCLATLDAETQAALKQADTATGRGARDVEVATKRPGAYTAFAPSSRAFAVYQQAQCDYVRAMQPDANAPPANVPSAADIARMACRIDLARDRIEILK